MITAHLEPKQLSDRELRSAFDDCMKRHDSDFALTLFALNVELRERVALLESRIVTLEGKRR